MSELIDRDALLKKAVTIPGPSGKSVFSVVFTDDILNAKPIEPTTKNNLGVDCVSRQEVDRLACRYLKEPTDNHVAFYEDFLDLPSITPQPRKGHWIEHPHEAGPNWKYSMYECSECHGWAEDDSDYCPDCGTKMVDPQESGDKDD